MAQTPYWVQKLPVTLRIPQVFPRSPLASPLLLDGIQDWKKRLQMMPVI